MRRLRSHRPSPSLVIACIALFVALGGTGYAALTLPKNSVKAKQLAPRSVSSSEAYNLTAKDFRAKARSKLRGPQGGQGPVGPPGPPGGAGTEALRPVSGPSADGNCDDNTPPPSGEFCFGEDASGWSNAGNGTTPAAFYRDGSGLVHLQGSVTGATISADFEQEVVFYLPAGYRPAQKLRFATSNNGTAAYLDIGPDGAVAPSVSVSLLLPLDGIVFRP